MAAALLSLIDVAEAAVGEVPVRSRTTVPMREDRVQRLRVGLALAGRARSAAARGGPA
jgi:hypothetical protein